MKCCPICKANYGEDADFCQFDGTILIQTETNQDDPFIGKTIKGRYYVLRKIDEGGMGAVYLAEQVSIGRKIALKLLHGHYARDAEFVRRFHSEARLAASLNHRNVVTIYDFDQTDDGRLFIAMEHVEGRNLKELLKEGPLDVAKAVRLAIQIARGLGAAHRAGVIHRDMKPENIMVSADADQAKLMDFGIARLRDTGDTRLTRAGAIVGTPAYMAPEQIEGKEVNERTDIYAFGIVLYEMLSGTVPFKATTPGAVVLKHLHENAIPLRTLRQEISQSIERVVTQALEKQPEKRQRDIQEVIQGLQTSEKTLRKTISTESPASSRTQNKTPNIRQRWHLKWPRHKLRVSISITVALTALIIVFVHVRPDREPSRTLNPTSPQDSRRKLPEPPLTLPSATPQTAIPKSYSQQDVNSKVLNHLKIARFFRGRGEYENAIGELEKARSIDPKNSEVQLALENVRKAYADKQSRKRVE